MKVLTLILLTLGITGCWNGYDYVNPDIKPRSDAAALLTAASLAELEPTPG